MPKNVANSAIACAGRALKLRPVPKTFATRPVPTYKCIQGVARALPGLSIVVTIRRVKGAVITEPPSHKRSQRRKCNPPN